MYQNCALVEAFGLWIEDDAKRFHVPNLSSMSQRIDV